ncbi:uncharacterized protein PAN0_003d1681 [Moesziomyces antarcticus]|uniref:uncharacterized protein n=1 Tax=Pseudozyma antarctica TaxID=84753 RepID=UPI000719706A|nr:uncharacterized protein PAN0_003d1681 [Moesziomyces antarcticus]GAK63476.1 hypothetical protein PAN0_003d1681 [Moesziomyces antarcticus]
MGTRKGYLKLAHLSLHRRHRHPRRFLSTIRLLLTTYVIEDAIVRYRTAEVNVQTCKDRAVDGQFLHDALLAGFEMHVHVSPTFMQRRSHVALDERPHFCETKRTRSNGATESASRVADDTRTASSEQGPRRRATQSLHGGDQRPLRTEAHSGASLDASHRVPALSRSRTLASHKLSHVVLDQDGSDDGRG